MPRNAMSLMILGGLAVVSAEHAMVFSWRSKGLQFLGWGLFLFGAAKAMAWVMSEVLAKANQAKATNAND